MQYSPYPDQHITSSIKRSTGVELCFLTVGFPPCDDDVGTSSSVCKLPYDPQQNRDQTINILIAKEPKQFGKRITEESSTMVNINAPIGMNKHVSIWTIVSTSLMMEVKEYGSNLKTTIYTKCELRQEFESVLNSLDF